MTEKLAMGFMAPEAFLEFLDAAHVTAAAGMQAAGAAGGTSASFWVALGAALAGGLALNLTPCVLPLVPVNAIVIGRGFRRGLAYAAGIVGAYGVLGCLAAFAGVPFATLAGSRWFAAVAAVVFAGLALGVAGVFHVDFSQFRRRRAGGGGGAMRLGGLVALGAMSATLAGACVAPILLAVLAEAALQAAAGATWRGALLPFALGFGMALPYPFLAAGLAHLPRPGAWMRYVNLAFGLVLAAMALRYALLAWRPGTADGERAAVAEADARPTEGKPRLYIIGAPWCGYCRQMEATTLRVAAVTNALARFDVRHLEIDDFDELRTHAELRRVADRIQGVPAYVVIPGGTRGP